MASLVFPPSKPVRPPARPPAHTAPPPRCVAVDLPPPPAPTHPRRIAAQATAGCGGTSFNVVDAGDCKWDHQQVKIQDQVTQLGMGSIPRSIVCLLDEDLVDGCKAGDDVLITGRVLGRPGAVRPWAPGGGGGGGAAGLKAEGLAGVGGGGRHNY